MLVQLLLTGTVNRSERESVTGCMMTINYFEEPQVCSVHSPSFRVYVCYCVYRTEAVTSIRPPPAVHVPVMH